MSLNLEDLVTELAVVNAELAVSEDAYNVDRHPLTSRWDGLMATIAVTPATDLAGVKAKARATEIESERTGGEHWERDGLGGNTARDIAESMLRDLSQL